MLFQLKIQLEYLDELPVWRQMPVPDHFSFHRLHRVIQAAFGRENCHLYQFSPNSYASIPIISGPNPEIDRDLSFRQQEKLDSNSTKLSDIFI